LAALAAVLLSVGYGSAEIPLWGFDGHAIVAGVAMTLLTTNATHHNQALLPEVAGDLAKIASWADDVRPTPAYAWSAPLHFADTKDWACNYDVARDCVRDRCVDGAIRNYTKRLADVHLPKAQQAEALKFLVHFVGDIHQPLHTGFVGDLGGNNLRGKFYGVAANLHGIWDYSIIEKKVKDVYGGDPLKYTADLVGRVKGPWAAQAATWRKCSTSAVFGSCAGEWAMESAGFACSNAYVEADGKTHIPQGFNIDDAYHNRNVPIIDERLARAGVRLANILSLVSP